MLILVGVTIHFTLGENGILKNAELAGNKYKEASENETNMLDQAYAYMNGEEKLQPNTPETSAGTKVKMPNNWYIQTPSIYSMPEAKEIEKSQRTANVYAVSDGKNNTIPIPKGFYYVGGNLDSGVVISDNVNDQNKYKNAEGGIVPSGVKVVEVEENGTKVKKLESELKGNQFVWIPCKEEEYHKTNWGQGNTNYSNCYWSAQTNSYELNQIKKYGGYYVGRYEAGLPNGTEEFKNDLEYYSDIYNFYGIPQSKAGILPWNFVSWTKAQGSARKMYENNESVSSGLITGTQWDVMINKIASVDLTKSLTSSKTWANCGDSDTFMFIGRKAGLNGESAVLKLNPFNNVEENGEKPNNKSYLLTTGASDQTKAYNLYDVAGNLWELTEEYSNSPTDVKTLENNDVLRGCSLDRGFVSACYRYGIGNTSSTAHNTGFRVVLYIH